MPIQTVLWKTAYEAAFVVLTGECPDLSELRRKAIAREVADAVMGSASRMEDPCKVANAAEQSVVELMHDWAAD